MLDIVTFGHPSLKMRSTDVTSFDNELKNLTDMLLEIISKKQICTFARIHSCP